MCFFQGPPAGRRASGGDAAGEEVLLLPLPPEDGPGRAATYAADFSMASSVASSDSTVQHSAPRGDAGSAPASASGTNRPAPGTASRPAASRRQAARGQGTMPKSRRRVTLAEVRAAATATDGTLLRSQGGGRRLGFEHDHTLRSPDERVVRRAPGVRGVGVDMRYRPRQPWWQRFVSGFMPFLRDLFLLDDV